MILRRDKWTDTKIEDQTDRRMDGRTNSHKEKFEADSLGWKKKSAHNRQTFGKPRHGNRQTDKWTDGQKHFKWRRAKKMQMIGMGLAFSRVFKVS